MQHDLSFALRAHHFLSVTSLRIALSKGSFATSFLSRQFSFSSSLSRLMVSSFAPIFLPPPMVGRRTDFQLLADLLHAWPPAKSVAASRSFLMISSGVSLAFHGESSGALARRQLSERLDRLLGSRPPRQGFCRNSSCALRLLVANRAFGCNFFDGVAMKRADSTYPVRIRAAAEEFRGWCKHRFLAEQRGTNRGIERLDPGKSCAR